MDCSALSKATSLRPILPRPPKPTTKKRSISTSTTLSVSKKVKLKSVALASPAVQVPAPLVTLTSPPAPEPSAHEKSPYQQLSLPNDQESSLIETSRDVLPAQEDELCNRCKSIDMVEELKGTVPPTGRYIMSLGKNVEDLKYARCPLCRLFASVSGPLEKRRRKDTEGYHLRRFDGTAMAGFLNSNQVAVGVPRIALGVCQGLSDRKMKAIEWLRSLVRGSISPILPHDPHLSAFQAQQVNREKVDFQQLRAWIQNCQDTHAGICGPKSSHPPAEFICIDVHSRLYKTDMKIDDEYYALSYVWGDHQGSSGSEDITNDTLGLPVFGVPQVIEDAMTAVQKLGGQFLWADKYCIKQWDPLHKDSQIQVMDKIYEGATATIIAATREGSGLGLPGVSRPRGFQQPTARVGHHLLVSTLSYASTAIAGSKWITRGWTYQEAALSVRWLVFTDEQVYFLCNTTSSCESITASFDTDKSCLTPRNFKNDALGSLGVIDQKPNGLWEFFENLHYYKSRKLSNESDSLNAFQGLLKRSKFKNIWGVPIACSNIPEDPAKAEIALSIGFARGLWWENPGDNWHDILKINENYVPYCRRYGFPGWSWAGWDGPTRHHKHRGDISSDTGCNEVDQKSFDIRFWVELECGTLISLNGIYRTLQATSPCPPLSHILHIETVIHQLRFRRHPKSGKPCVCDCPPEVQGNKCLKLHPTFTHNIRFFEEQMANECVSETICFQLWNVFPLFRAKDPETPCLVASFVIDWLDESNLLAQVKGVAYLHEKFFSSGRRMKFRLA